MRRFRVATAVALMVAGAAWLIFTASRVEGIVYRAADDIRAEASPSKTYRLMGKAQAGSIEKSPQRRSVTFTVIEPDGGRMTAIYEGIIPDTFRDSADVVVSGRYDRSNDRLVADELQAKCPSKYEGQFNPHLGDTRPRV